MARNGDSPLKEHGLAKGLATRSIDLEPIDRLEEKLKLLVGVIERLRGDSARMAEENTRLSRELDSARARLTEAEGTNAEMAALREERDLIRARVDEMLQQIESLNL
jgi:regulator of replication initiation timing